MNSWKAKWIKALRSNKYEQGYKCLSRNNQYCCLGVLCELGVQENLISKWQNPQNITFYNGRSAYLGQEARDVFGLITQSGNFIVTEKIRDLVREYISLELGEMTSLASLNDYRVPFRIIADVIECDPKGLFDRENSSS